MKKKSKEEKMLRKVFKKTACPACVSGGKGEICFKHFDQAVKLGLVFPNGNRTNETCPLCGKDGGQHGKYWFPCAFNIAAKKKLSK